MNPSMILAGAQDGIVTAARFQQQLETAGGNIRAAIGAIAVVVGVVSIFMGLVRTFQYAKQDNGERQQKKYSITGTVVLYVLGIVAITGGIWGVMAGKNTGLDLTTQDVIGDNGYGQVSHCGNGAC